MKKTLLTLLLPLFLTACAKGGGGPNTVTVAGPGPATPAICGFQVPYTSIVNACGIQLYNAADTGVYVDAYDFSTFAPGVLTDNKASSPLLAERVNDCIIGQDVDLVHGSPGDPDYCYISILQNQITEIQDNTGVIYPIPAQ
jgi:hypothetical protein